MPTPSLTANAAPTGLAVWFTPGIQDPDVWTAYWVRQANLRLRRELCWAWRHAHPPDSVSEALDRARLQQQRLEFFAHDDTARYLTQAIVERPPRPPLRGPRGAFPWLAAELRLELPEIFAAAFALMHSWDPAVADVVGAAQSDPRRTSPTLGLLQCLWDEPGAIIPLTSPSHPLFLTGILRPDTAEALDWRTAITMPALIAGRLLGTAAPLPPGFRCFLGAQPLAPLSAAAQLVALRACEPIASPHAIPLRGAGSAAGDDTAELAQVLEAFSAVTGRPIYSWNPARPGADTQTAAVLCWLSGADLHFHPQPAPRQERPEPPFTGVPIYVLADWQHQPPQLPGWGLLPPLDVPLPDFPARLECWRQAFPASSVPAGGVLEDCAFRFRFGRAVIEEIARALIRRREPVTQESLIAACRQRAEAHPGSLAVRVKPRFTPQELVLPPLQQKQFAELLTALQTVSRVHAQWGTGRVWNDAGISALFAGPPGTGKTMAAEALATALGYPMFCVDLSQVVNKYIGETEKNLKQLFDAMESCDALLFFDEADAIFGQRTQVRNSNDRFANMEVSYLLQRMERFRGVAILATNRRKDLDEAFLRRLRFVMEFPLPGCQERRRIWTSGIPAEVGASQLDFDFLSAQFALSGGNIRSIILHACLQSAGQSPERKLSMDTVMRSLQREFQKLGRTLTREQCGAWSAVCEEES